MEPADRHVTVVERLAQTYEQPLTLAIASWNQGLRRVVDGELEAALAAYAEAERRMSQVGTWPGMVDTLAVSTVCAWLGVGRLAELPTQWDEKSMASRLYPELYALALAAAGRIDDAQQVAGPPTAIRSDYALDLNWAVRGLLGIAIGDVDRAATAYSALLPYEHLLAAAGTGVVIVAPVAEILGDLAGYLGQPARARDHYAQALGISRRAGARHWADRAAEALRRLQDTTRSGIG